MSSKKDRAEDFVKMFTEAIERYKGLKSLGEITLVSDAKFGYIVRNFGKSNVLIMLAELAAAELRFNDFLEEEINRKKEEFEKSFEKEVSDFDEEYEQTNVVPPKKQDLN
jgi:hypothetical protein